MGSAGERRAAVAQTSHDVGGEPQSLRKAAMDLNPLLHFLTVIYHDSYLFADSIYCTFHFLGIDALNND